MPKRKRPGEAKRFGRRYPWHEWFSQDEFLLRKGRDFNGRVDTMANQIRGAAMADRYDVKVSIRIWPDMETLEVKVLQRDYSLNAANEEGMKDNG